MRKFPLCLIAVLCFFVVSQAQSPNSSPDPQQTPPAGASNATSPAATSTDAAPSDVPSAPPTVAEAAREARERKKTTTPKRTLTDDDVTHSASSGGAAEISAMRASVRDSLDASTPAIPTRPDMERQLAQMKMMSNFGAAVLLGQIKQSALAAKGSSDFPGKKEWEQRASDVANGLVDSATNGAADLQALIDANSDTLAGADRGRLATLRVKWIDVMVPYASWTKLAQDVLIQGHQLSAGTANGNPGRGAQPRSAKADSNEAAVYPTMVLVHQNEAGIRVTRGRYTCNPGDFNSTPGNQPTANITWINRVAELSAAGYHIEIHSCDATHFFAVGVPPVIDGSQGRAFCTDQTGAVRVVSDGNAADCETWGRTYTGR